MVETVVFMLGSVGFIVLSRHALTRLDNHGFPRFFAFEALLGLVVLDARYWLINPFSPAQIASWILLLLAAYLALHAIWALHTYGASDPASLDTNRIGFEKTTQLVTEGPYRLLRHPMYASLLYLGWGIFLKHIDLQSGLLAFIASLALFLTAVYEEKENLDIFGEAYAGYMQHTKRFIPMVF